MRPFHASFFTDTVVVFPAVYGQDSNLGLTKANAAGTTLACSVQRVNGTSVTQQRSTLDGVTIGDALYNLIFPEEPPVAEPDQEMHWTAHQDKDGISVPYASPLVLIAMGRTEPPGGLLEGIWTVAARLRS